MTRWQYATEQFLTAGLGDEAAAADLERVLDARGADGWELLGLTTYHNAEARADVLIATFKRPVPQNPGAPGTDDRGG